MAAGDESALAELYDRWATRIHSIAHWILRDTTEAEDVVEETFWQAWRTAADFDQRRAATVTWLAMIARSRALDRLRRRRRLERTVTEASALEGSHDGTGPANLEQPGAYAERMERADGLGAALTELSADQRAVIDLAFFGGLTHTEIAARMALPLGTVKTRIRLAMQKLKRQLAPRHQEDR